jgi:hypothetical protein
MGFAYPFEMLMDTFSAAIALLAADIPKSRTQNSTRKDANETWLLIERIARIKFICIVEKYCALSDSRAGLSKQMHQVDNPP